LFFVSADPLDEYAEAVQLRKTDRALAAEKLAKSLGGDKATAPILSGLDKIFEPDTPLHKSVTHAVVSESLRRERREKETAKQKTESQRRNV
jgi:hypothetical protein